MSFGEEEPKSSREGDSEDILLAELKLILNAAYKADAITTHAGIVEEAERLRRQFGKEALQRSRLYHLMVGSTPDAEAGAGEPNAELDEAIASFIRGLGAGREGEE